jgi:hypothetical protein
MALFQWPEDRIPAPSTSFVSDIATPVFRSVMASGKTRQRNQASSELSFYDVVWSLTDLQRGYFKTLVKDSLTGGADWFEITLPVNSGMELVKARFVGGRYDEAYQPTFHWNVSATLECVDVPTVTPAELAALLVQLESEGC